MTDAVAWSMKLRLAREEGLLVGVRQAYVAAAIDVARDSEQESP